MCVIIGADELGRKELLAIADGYRESAQSWREVLLDLKRRGLAIAPELATGDGALGFWKALREVYGTTREQRCLVHKTANVLNKLPKSVQPRAKQHLQDIWMAETRAVAEKAFDFFLEAYGPKYDKAVACLAKDRDVLLAFYDFPAEHSSRARRSGKGGAGSDTGSRAGFFLAVGAGFLLLLRRFLLTGMETSRGVSQEGASLSETGAQRLCSSSMPHAILYDGSRDIHVLRGNFMRFADYGKRVVFAAFDGGEITSDAGVLLLRERARRIRLFERMAGCFTDHRDRERLTHALPALLAQRVCGMALGYEDIIDHDTYVDAPCSARRNSNNS